MSLSKLSGETLVYGLSSILGRLLNFALLTPFVTRILTEEEFGQIGNLMFWTAFLIALLVFRLDTAVFRFASRGDYAPAAVFRRAQRLVALFSALILLPLFLLADPLSELLQVPGAAHYVRLVLLTVGCDALSAVPLARLRLRGRAWTFVAVNLINVALNIGLVYYLLYFLPLYRPEQFDPGFRVGYILLAMAVAALARLLLLLAHQLRDQPSAVRASPLDATLPAAPPTATPSFRRLVSYSLPLTVVSVAGIANSLVGPTILLPHDEAVAGYFTAVLRMAVFLNLFVTAYQYAAEPFFFRQSGADLATADRTIYADALRAYGLIGSLACAGILLGLPWLQLFIGEDVRAGLKVLPIVLAANFLFGVYSNLSIAYKLTDKTFLGGGIALAGSLCAVGGPLLFVPTYGIYAAAIGMLACFALMCVLAYAVSRRYFPVRYPFVRLLLFTGLASIAVLLGGLSEALAYRILLLVLLAVALLVLERQWLRRTFLGADAGAG